MGVGVDEVEGALVRGEVVTGLLADAAEDVIAEQSDERREVGAHRPPDREAPAGDIDRVRGDLAESRPGCFVALGVRASTWTAAHADWGVRDCSVASAGGLP